MISFYLVALVTGLTSVLLMSHFKLTRRYKKHTCRCWFRDQIVVGVMDDAFYYFKSLKFSLFTKKPDHAKFTKINNTYSTLFF